jgi:NAD(P)-dependent dehydrogenase (short-subunit alcohol dehydrogenase family)
MPESRPPIDLKGLSLAELQRLIDERKLPPVDRWNPQHCGSSDMRIARDGTWYHLDRPIGRPVMVRLFSTVLRREPDGSHVLVTPVEKLTIDVEGAAFRAVELESEGEGRERQIALRLDSGDALIVNLLDSKLSAPNPDFLSYTVSKQALAGFTELAARALAADGIRVNAIAPGVIKTPFHDRHTGDSQMQAMLTTIPMGRTGTPHECVGTLLFLASERMSSYVTGQIIEVNGGQLTP